MIDAGTILQMIRMEHHITRHELAKQFGTTYEAIKEIEDNNGDVPDEWLIYLYNNYDLSPEELYLLEYISDMPVVDNTEVIHTYKGYTACCTRTAFLQHQKCRWYRSNAYKQSCKKGYDYGRHGKCY